VIISISFFVFYMAERRQQQQQQWTSLSSQPASQPGSRTIYIARLKTKDSIKKQQQQKLNREDDGNKDKRETTFWRERVVSLLPYLSLSLSLPLSLSLNEQRQLFRARNILSN